MEGTESNGIYEDNLMRIKQTEGDGILIEKIIHGFVSIYTPGGKVLYVGDRKFAHFDEQGLAGLGVTIESHENLPNAIIHCMEKDRLVLIEAVPLHGPIDDVRKDGLEHLFRNSRAKLVFVTAFLTQSVMKNYFQTISWGTKIWVADYPTHLIDLDGEQLLGPYEENK